MNSQHSIKLPMVKYDEMKMSISIYFKCQCRLPPYTPCVSIASCHSARGEEGQEQQIFIKYLSRANFTILPSLLICSRYLLICCSCYLSVCLFASISANVGDLLVSAASGRETLIILIMRPTPALCDCVD